MALEWIWLQTALSDSLQNQMGVIVTNTVNSTIDQATEEKLENCTELLPMGHITVQTAQTLKNLIEKGEREWIFFFCISKNL